MVSIFRDNEKALAGLAATQRRLAEAPHIDAKERERLLDSAKWHEARANDWAERAEAYEAEEDENDDE